jgi:3-deoxy-manno-octulosonate cytidylyltransferase (CMP-KDO synthetase)
MRAIAVIPARYASTRFPGKPLAADTGQPLIQHVYERARQARRIARIVVATDDARILDAVRGFGGVAVMTRPDHPSGTDRIIQAAEGLDADLFLNIQGDEPEIDPGHLDGLIELMEADPEAEVGTLACPFAAIAGSNPRDPNAVKVVLDVRGRAIYFSRSLIPYPRAESGAWSLESGAREVGPRLFSGEPQASALQTSELGGQCPPHAPHLLHVGVYAYRPAFLTSLVGLAPTPLERTEQLEQLRWLEHGHRIAVRVVDSAAKGIDTRDDYAAFVKRWRESVE